MSPIVAAMNAMRYDAAAIGNHEFNYGVPFLDRAVGQARFPFLSANAYRVDGPRTYRAWTIVERAGARVAIVGATTPGVNVWDRDNVRGRVTVRAIIPDVRAAVREARAAGADVIVVVLHSGLSGASSYDTVSTGAASENVTAQVAREVEGIDLIVFGHSHREVADTTIGTTLLVQPKNWAGSVAVAHLELRRANDRWIVGAKRGEVIRTAGRRESEAVLAATASAHAEAGPLRDDTDRPHDRGVARRFLAGHRHAARRLHSRDATACGRCRARVDRRVLTRGDPRYRRNHRRRARATVPVRQYAARDPYHRKAAAGVPRVQRAILRHRGNQRVACRSPRARLQLRHRRGCRVHHRRITPGRVADNAPGVQGPCRPRRRFVHDCAQQLSADGRRRLRHARRRARRL